jgi:hypothetical protein
MKLVVAAAAFCIAAAAAQSQPDGSAADASDLPRLSSMMAQQQMRHIKLWFAGDAGNWPLADYEFDALKDGFDDVGRLVGDDIVREHVAGAVSALEKSIDAKDRDAFVRAFDQLSESCNACHRTLDHAFIVIQRPALSPYSDQNFSPQK